MYGTGRKYIRTQELARVSVGAPVRVRRPPLVAAAEC